MSLSYNKQQIKKLYIIEVMGEDLEKDIQSFPNFQETSQLMKLCAIS